MGERGIGPPPVFAGSDDEDSMGAGVGATMSIDDEQRRAVIQPSVQEDRPVISHGGNVFARPNDAIDTWNDRPSK